MPAFIDAVGRFQRLIARHGTGPGEISGEAPIALAPGDSIWVIDRLRKLVFSPAADFVREERLASRGGLEAIVTAAGRVVTADRVQTPDAAGYPLHLRDAQFNIIRSFGALDPTLDPRRLAATRDDPSIYLERWLTREGATSFWAYNPSRFLLEQYDVDGRLLAQFRHALDGWYGEATQLKPSPGEFSGLVLHAVQPSANSDLIWLVYHHPRPGYARPEDGTPFIWEDWIAGHDLVVEAFDFRRNEVVVTARFPQTEGVRVRHGTDMLGIVRPTRDGFVSLQVVTLHVVRSQP